MVAPFSTYQKKKKKKCDCSIQISKIVLVLGGEISREMVGKGISS